MAQILFGVLAAAVIALVILLIWMGSRLGETLSAFRGFMETTAQAMQTSLAEVNQNLASVRTLTDNMNKVASDVAAFSESVREVGDAVGRVAATVKEMSETVEDLGTETVASVRGLRAGVKTGFDVFLKNLFQRG